MCLEAHRRESHKSEWLNHRDLVPDKHNVVFNH